MRRISLIVLTILFFNCSNKNAQVVVEKEISLRTLNFQDDHVSNDIMNLKIISDLKSKQFIYSNKDRKDTLKINQNKEVYLNSNLLKKIDQKEVDFNNKPITIVKYFIENKRDFRFNAYCFINEDKGILFEEGLFSGAMTEYDTNEFNFLHKAIAMRTMGFKEGKFENRFAKMEYPELKIK